jgi:hypothetical protein
MMSLKFQNSTNVLGIVTLNIKILSKMSVFGDVYISKQQFPIMKWGQITTVKGFKTKFCTVGLGM